MKNYLCSTFGNYRCCCKTFAWFSIKKFSPKFYSVKCKIELEIESLFPIEIFEYAESKNWLEYRNQTFISNPTDWEQHHQTTSQYIISKGIEEKNLLYTKKVKMSKKIAFSNYVMNLEDKKNTFKNFEPLIKEIIKSLKINE